MIEPRQVIRAIGAPEHCVICFFREVIEKVRTRGKLLSTRRSEMGKHPVYEISVRGRRLALFHPGVGAPLAAGLLEEVIALGCRKFVVCGAGGALDRDLVFGRIVVPSSAVRDEGTSYHYLPPGREANADPRVVRAIRRTLRARSVPYVVGKTWTTDAFYRETPAKVRRRRAEGCLTVEMEAAALFAVAHFRKVALGQILYAADDVSGDEWDLRGSNKNLSPRERLFQLAVESCLIL